MMNVVRLHNQVFFELWCLGGHRYNLSMNNFLNLMLSKLGRQVFLHNYHRDYRIHIERACLSMNTIMTQHRLLHKGFHISCISWAHWYKQKIFCLDKWPNLGYADVKLNIPCMHPLACLHTLSLYVYPTISMIITLKIWEGGVTKEISIKMSALERFTVTCTLFRLTDLTAYQLETNE